MVREELIRKIDSTKQKLSGNKMPLTDNVLGMLGYLLSPQEDKFEQVNLDMGFTNLDRIDRSRTENFSTLITICGLYGLEKSKIMAKSQLSTLLISARSKNATAMNLFNTTVTKSDQKFVDETDTSKGFKFFNFAKKKR